MARDEDKALEDLASAAGIAVDWEDAASRPQRVEPPVLRNLLEALGLPAGSAAQIRDSRSRLEAESAGAELPPLITAVVGEPTPLPPALLRDGAAKVTMEDGRRIERPVSDGRLASLPTPGYHRVELGEDSLTLAVAPHRCFTLADASGGEEKLWGLAAQLYGLRRKEGGCGFGDFTALARLARETAPQGCSAIAISPVHAMFPAEPERISPYSPSSRLMLNPLYADPAEVLGEEALRRVIAERKLGEELADLEAQELIDWPRAARVKFDIFRTLFERMHGDRERMAAFEAFRDAGGLALTNHARFEALQAHFVAQDPALADWRSWPAGLQDPASAEVTAFAETHADQVAFHAFLQWRAAEGLGAAQAAARDAGMAVGLISDLAVGADGGGSQAWAGQDDNLIGLTIGAPPDLYNPLGQSWGLNAFSPRGLRRNGFRSFIAMLRASLAQAGGIRIDHVMGLMRLWLLPEGASARDGAYLAYPLEDLLRLVALESWRHRAIVIGEDLGTVPEGFRDILAERAILGMSVLWFEMEKDGGFTRPERWRENSAAMSSTHDLPPIAGWWRGSDLEVRRGLRLFESDEDVGDAEKERQAHRLSLWRALRPGERTPPPAQAPVDDCLAYLGRSACRLAIVPLEDMLGLEAQPNLPGTTSGHPNWRRRLPMSVGDLASAPPLPGRMELLSRTRAAASGQEGAAAARRGNQDRGA